MAAGNSSTHQVQPVQRGRPAHHATTGQHRQWSPQNRPQAVSTGVGRSRRKACINPANKANAENNPPSISKHTGWGSVPFLRDMERVKKHATQAASATGQRYPPPPSPSFPPAYASMHRRHHKTWLPISTSRLASPVGDTPSAPCRNCKATRWQPAAREVRLLSHHHPARLFSCV